MRTPRRPASPPPPPTAFGPQPAQAKLTDRRAAGLPPPSTAFGPQPVQAKSADRRAAGLPPPPTAFGPQPVQAKPADRRPATLPPLTTTFGPRPYKPVPQAATRNGQTIQPWAWAAAGTIGLAAIGLKWAWSQVNQLNETLGQAAREGLEEGAEMALDTINPIVPSFPNRQRAHYAHELGTFRHAQQNGQDARVLSFRRQRDAFKALVMSGEQFLWTVDTDGDLVIGTAHPAVKHCIVAGDEDVFAAGMGQLELTPDEDRWNSYKNFKHKADVLVQQGILDPGNNPYIELARNMEPITKPPERMASLTVVLDFDSGHYAPSGAWRKTCEAWEAAGYTVKKNRGSRRL